MSEVKNMPDGWVETTLGEICLVGDGAHSKVDRKKSGVLYLTAKNFNRGNLKLDSIDYISIEDFDKLFSKNSKAVTRLKENDVLMGIIGSFGNAYRYKKDDFFGISSSVAILRPNTEILSPQFLELYLNSNLFRRLHETYSSGSVQGYSNIPTIKTMPIILPSILEQKSIAAILTAFDDKIELLQAQNKTLEETAQTIFTEWFGKYQIEDVLPEGWRVGKLGDLVEKISKGTTPRKDDLVGLYGEIPFLKVKDISNEGLILKNNLELIPRSVHENQLKRSILETNDILFSIAGTIGRLTIVDLEMNNTNCNQALAFIRLKDKYSFLEFIHLWLKSKETQDVINSNIVQGVQANVSLTVLGNLLLLIPNTETINNWCDLIKPIYKKLQTNTEQIQTLTKTRDELLPRLMSGEVRVKQLK